MYSNWEEMSWYKFPSFANSFERDEYESWNEEDEEEAEEDEECLD